MPYVLDIPRAQAPVSNVVTATGRRGGSDDDAAGDLRAAIGHYEQHVIAWYALGRVTEAWAARDAIARCREKLGSTTNISVTPTGHTTLVTLRLELDTNTIRGRLADEHGNERPFWGWLELSGALDELRGADARRGDSATAFRARDANQSQEGQ